MYTFCAMLLAFSGTGGDATGTSWDFEDAALGKLPANWSSAQTGKGKGSAWKVLEDKTAPKGAKVLAQTSPDGPGPLFNLCVADKSNFADLDLTLSLKAMAGEVDQGGGPVWRYKDNKNYYVARANPLENNFRVYKVEAGKRIQLGTAAIKMETGKWHTIRVVHKGEHIQCYFDGKLHLDAKDATFKDAGKIGLWTKADAQTAFDGIVVRNPK